MNTWANIVMDDGWVHPLANILSSFVINFWWDIVMKDRNSDGKPPWYIYSQVWFYHIVYNCWDVWHPSNKYAIVRKFEIIIHFLACSFRMQSIPICAIRLPLQIGCHFTCGKQLKSKWYCKNLIILLRQLYSFHNNKVIIIIIIVIINIQYSAERQ